MSERHIDISDGEYMPSHHNRPSKRKSKKLLLVLLAVVLLTALAAAGWKWYGQLREYRVNIEEREKRISELENQLAQQGQNSSGGIYKTNQFSFTVPNGWVVVKQPLNVPQQPGDTPLESYKITNPKTGFQVEYTSGPGGLGGGCEPNQRVQQQLIDSKELNNSKFAEPTFYAEKIAPNSNDRYTVWFGITNNNDVSEKVCENTSYMITTLKDTPDNIFFFGGGLTGYIQEFANEKDAKKFLQSNDYQAAKKMILSIR